MNGMERTSAIRSVGHYVASPVECCDRCSAGIKYVYVVRYQDGLVQKYGSECINRILDEQPTLQKLFTKNAKLLAKYQDYMSVFSQPDAMPRGSEYFGSGLYFVADSKGKDISFERWFFHPQFDADKNAAGRNYVVNSPSEHVQRCTDDIERAKVGIAKEIARIEAFLGKVLRAAQQKQLGQ